MHFVKQCFVSPTIYQQLPGLDPQIDSLVCELCELTEGEIEIVES